MDMQIIRTLLPQVINPEELIRRYNAAKTVRESWDSQWDLIKKQVYPNLADYTSKSKNYEPQLDVINNHAGKVSGMIDRVVSLIASTTADPSSQWLYLSFGYPSLNESKEARDWLFRCTQDLYALFADPDSNFYPSSFSFYQDWYTLGTACREIILREDTGNIRFNCVSMQNIYAELSGYGDIQTIYRKFDISAAQAFDMWGDRCNPEIIEFAHRDKQSAYKKKFEFFEIVMPNPLKSHPLIIEKKLQVSNYLSCIIDVLHKEIVSFNLYDYLPYIISRYFVTPGETYGRSKVWYIIPDTKVINMAVKRLMQGVDYAIFPIFLTEDATSFPTNSLMPGALVQGLDPNGRPQIMPLQMVGDLNIALKVIEQKEISIAMTLGINELFPPDDTSARTATEVRQRVIERNTILRPMIVRLESEDLNRTVKRSLELLRKLGRLTPFPYEEVGIDPKNLPDPIEGLRVSFSGQMEVMQKMQDVQNMDTILEKAAATAQIDPTVLDVVNVEQIISEESKYLHLPPNVINSEKVIRQIREERAKQQEEQMRQMQEDKNMENMMKLMNLENQTKGGFNGYY